MGVASAYGSTATRCISSTFAGGHTTTMRLTRAAASNASSVHVMRGFPATSISNLPPGLPKRVPKPPATTIAQVRTPVSVHIAPLKAGRREIRAAPSK